MTSRSKTANRLTLRLRNVMRALEEEEEEKRPQKM